MRIVSTRVLPLPAPDQDERRGTRQPARDRVEAAGPPHPDGRPAWRQVQAAQQVAQHDRSGQCP
jgi:hypothetical protein